MTSPMACAGATHPATTAGPQQRLPTGVESFPIEAIRNGLCALRENRAKPVWAKPPRTRPARGLFTHPGIGFPSRLKARWRGNSVSGQIESKRPATDHAAKRTADERLVRFR